jgi:hypothetical protein
MGFKIAEKVFATAGAEPLSATSITAARALVQVKRSNSNAVELGPADMTTGKGIELAAPESGKPLDSRELVSSNGGNTVDLSTIYGLGSIGEGVNIYYEEY